VVRTRGPGSTSTNFFNGLICLSVVPGTLSQDRAGETEEEMRCFHFRCVPELNLLHPDAEAGNSLALAAGDMFVVPYDTRARDVHDKLCVVPVQAMGRVMEVREVKDGAWVAACSEGWRVQYYADHRDVQWYIPVHHLRRHVLNKICCLRQYDRVAVVNPARGLETGTLGHVSEMPVIGENVVKLMLHPPANLDGQKRGKGKGDAEPAEVKVGSVPLTSIHRCFMLGDSVRVCGGVLEGWEGQISRILPGRIVEVAGMTEHLSADSQVRHIARPPCYTDQRGMRRSRV
jgi:hypothetical protein